MSHDKIPRFKKQHRIQMFLLIFIATVAILSYLMKGQETFSSDIAVDAGGDLTVQFIDVGQADCILIQSGSHNMLIDAGNNDDAETVITYLEKQNVTHLDYVIGSHGHEDHIGGLDEVIRKFPIGELFMPAQQYDTKSYKEVWDAAKEKKLPVTIPEFKGTRRLGLAQFIFVTPDPKDNYEDLNDSSLGIRISNGTHSFLLCGDISKSMEKRIIKSDIYLHSDVLKLNHHGSSDANSKAFLKSVAPEYGVICCELGNDFGHPHNSTLKKLKQLDIRTFRTDEQGTIIFTSNGNQLTCNVNPLE